MIATVFDVDRYPANGLDTYGQRDLDLLVRHYSPIINPERARRAFLPFKTTLVNYGLVSFDATCRCVIRQLC